MNFIGNLFIVWFNSSENDYLRNLSNFKFKGAFPLAAQSCATQRRRTKANSAKQQNGAKLCLLVLKKIGVRRGASQFHFLRANIRRRKPEVRQKCCHWVTPLFKSRISLLLNISVTQWRRFKGTLLFFFSKYFSPKYFKKAPCSAKRSSLFLNNGVT